MKAKELSVIIKDFVIVIDDVKLITDTKTITKRQGRKKIDEVVHVYGFFKIEVEINTSTLEPHYVRVFNKFDNIKLAHTYFLFKRKFITEETKEELETLLKLKIQSLKDIQRKRIISYV